MTTMMRPMLAGTTPLSMKRPKLNLDISANTSPTTSLYSVNSTSFNTSQRPASLSQLKSKSLSNLTIPTPISPSSCHPTGPTYSTGTPTAGSFSVSRPDTPLSATQESHRPTQPPYTQPAHLKSILLNGPFTLSPASHPPPVSIPEPPPNTQDPRPQSSPPDLEPSNRSSPNTIRQLSPKRVIFSPEPPFHIPVPISTQDESTASTPSLETDPSVTYAPAHIPSTSHPAIWSPRHRSFSGDHETDRDLDESGGSDTPVRGNHVKEREWVWTIDNDDHDDHDFEHR